MGRCRGRAGRRRAAKAACLALGATVITGWLEEWGLPSQDLTRFRRVLAIFPHPDDETVACGGTLRRLAGVGVAVTLVALTRGEAATVPGLHSDAVGRVRAAELERAAAQLGVARVLQLQLPDGRLGSCRAELRQLLEEILGQSSPDLVITYDPSGLYGHPDHVACSQVVTEVCGELVPGCRLWYVALPRGLRWALVGLRSLPVSPGVAGATTLPTLKVWIGMRPLWSKSLAWRAHRSQRGAIGSGVARLIPGWAALPLLPVEHFHEVIAVARP
ncbi:MAG: PIG-L deacetylase family protein [Candidatus Dormibacteria bacterium]